MKRKSLLLVLLFCLLQSAFSADSTICMLSDAERKIESSFQHLQNDHSQEKFDLFNDEIRIYLECLDLDKLKAQFEKISSNSVESEKDAAFAYHITSVYMSNNKESLNSKIAFLWKQIVTSQKMQGSDSFLFKTLLSELENYPSVEYLVGLIDLYDKTTSVLAKELIIRNIGNSIPDRTNRQIYVQYPESMKDVSFAKKFVVHVLETEPMVGLLCEAIDIYTDYPDFDSKILISVAQRTGSPYVKDYIERKGIPVPSDLPSI